MATDPLLNQKLGDYTIIDLLGKGGMARVYRGYDENLDRYAAIKVISGDFATSDETEYNERFLKEARAIARLNHTNIVGVYQFGNAEGVYYMAMHFLDGEDLRVILRRYAKAGQKMPKDDILRMGRDMADALDYAHREGVVHRDIKPSNIMILNNNGRAVLTDFGLALSVPEGTMGDTFGTAHYIAPEQAISSANAVPQSDLYSFGIVLYEALAGQVPFDEPSAMSVALKHLNDMPPPPSIYNPEIPEAAEEVLLRALAKEPAERYATGNDLLDALEEALGQAAPTNKRISTASGIVPEENDLHSYLASVEQSSSKPPSPIPDPRPSDATQPWSPSMMERPSQLEAMQLQQQRNNRIVMLALLAVIILVGAVIAFLVMSDNNGDNEENLQQALLGARQTENAENRAASQTAIALFTDTPTPSDTPTNTPTHTPTDTPTDTPTNIPTNTPTNTPTHTPTNTPTHTPSPTDTPTHTPSPTDTPTDTPEPTEAAIVPTPLPPQVRLVYTTDWLLMSNITDEAVDLSQLRFEQNDDIQGRRFDVNSDFSMVESSNLPPDACLQLVRSPSMLSDPDLVDLCGPRERIAWAAPGRSSLFWTNETQDGRFEVRLGRRILAECNLQLNRQGFGTCEFTTERPLILDSSSAISPPQPTDTPDPTETPRPSATRTPTDEPTEAPTATEAPTDEPTEEATQDATEEADDAELRLVYNDQRVYIINISNQRQNINALRFVQGTTISFAASQWANTGFGSPSLFSPGACFLLVTTPSAAELPDECVINLGWVQGNFTDRFWIERNADTFQVRTTDALITECDIAAGQCSFSLE